MTPREIHRLIRQAAPDAAAFDQRMKHLFQPPTTPVRLRWPMITAQQVIDLYKRLKQLEDDADRQREMIANNAVVSLNQRDMIAMAASGGIAGNMDLSPEQVADRAYAVADAMLKERTKS